MMFGRTRTKIVCEADVSKVNWCDSAVVVSVKNGRGTLTHISSPDDGKYSDYSCNLTLEGITLVQGKYSYCPTCEGLLASGYGLENVECGELDRIRSTVNEGYSDIRDAAEKLMPLLGLLDDGYYLIADVEHYPSDGRGNFFYNMSNELSVYDGCCDDYYLYGLFTAVSCYPAFLIPTQSADRTDRERVDYYKEKLLKNPDSVRGIAYYEKGFYSALLDGHHKAFAAAELGIPLRCITIIRGYHCRTMSRDTGKLRSEVDFCGFSIQENAEIKAPAEIKYYGTRKNVTSFVSSVAGRGYRISCKKYPTAQDLAVESELFGEDSDFTVKADEWIAEGDAESCTMLKYALHYLMRVSPDEARTLAIRITQANDGCLPVQEAWKTLLNFRDEETEKLFIDYIVNSGKDHYAYDTVMSYWD